MNVRAPTLQSNLYNYLLYILAKHEFYFSYTNGTIVYDTLLFWYNNFKAQIYIIYLFLKIKYNLKHYDMTIPRYNFIWALRRNFFLKNIISLFNLPETETTQCFKYYIVLRQLLDDIFDIYTDNQMGIISLANQKRSIYSIKNLKHKLSQYINKKNCGVIGTPIIKFYLQFMQKY